jgi:hypothetical protein
MTLRRLVLEFGREGEILLRALYKRQDSPAPGTKARRGEVQALSVEGLTAALQALEGRVEVVGTSGYDVREDTLSADGRAA